MAPEGLTTPRDAKEHKHDTLPWIIVAEHGSKAASSLDFPWQAPTGHLPMGPKERPPLVIVAKLNPRRAAPTSGRKPMPCIAAAAIIQMRRLQEGSDADGATVACPKWTEFSPLDDMLEGNTTPPTGRRRRRQGFRPRTL